MHRLLCVVGLLALTSHLEGQETRACWDGLVGEAPRVTRAVLDEDAGVLTYFNREPVRLRVADARQAGDTLHLKLEAMSGAQESESPRSATLVRSADGDALTGTYTRSETTLPLRLERVPGRTEPPPERLRGTWAGRIEAFGLRVVVHVDEGPCGLTVGTLDSPDQGAAGLPFTRARSTGDSLFFGMAYIGASYQGVLAPDGEAIEGQFSQGGITSPLRLARGEEVAELRRPQEPEPPFPYRVEELVIENEAGGVRLAGTLTIPPGEGPFPAAVLLTGSGAQDRDETLMGHKPFLVLADHLTRRGIAVLRTDDRGVGGSTGDTFESTLEDIAGDALSMVAYLKGRPEIDPGAIGLIGHSEGGWVAPIAATKSADVAYLVLLAGPGVSGEEILYAQRALLARAEGVPEEIVSLIRRTQEATFRLLKEHLREGRDREDTKERIRRTLDELRAQLPEETRARLDSITGNVSEAEEQALLDRGLEIQLTPWFLYLLTYDPGPVLRRIRQPVLVLIGEKDLQVPPEQNVPALRAAFAEAGHPDATVEVLPGLNHLFQHAETGHINEYGRIEETIAPDVLDRVAGWILERFGPTATRERRTP